MPVYHYFREHPDVLSKTIYYVLLALVTAVSYAGYYWAFRVRRRIGSLRWRLQNLGVTRDVDIDHFVRLLVDTKGLGDDYTAIRTAFTDLMRGVKVHDRHGAITRINRVFSRISEYLYPYKLRGVNEETLKRHLDEICEYFDKFQTVRRAGQPAHEKEEFFFLRRLIATTSFGEVWLAESRDQEESHEFYFFTDIKKLAEMRSQREALPRRFKQLGSDPNIVQWFNFGFYRKRIPYLEMEHLPGLSLKNWMLVDAEQRPELQAAQIMRGIISGLAAAHDRRVYHQHLEPDKILLTEPFDERGNTDQLQAKVSEFCIGGVTGAAEWHPVMNNSRAPGGGPQSRRLNAMYLPPEIEHAGEQPSRAQADVQRAQADVYALGIIWYQLLVGRTERPPYDFAERLREMKVDAPTIHRVSRCLAHADGRYENARKLADEIAKPQATVVRAPAAKQILIGHYDISDLLSEYIRSAEHETYPPVGDAETAPRSTTFSPGSPAFS